MAIPKSFNNPWVPKIEPPQSNRKKKEKERIVIKEGCKIIEKAMVRIRIIKNRYESTQFKN